MTWGNMLILPLWKTPGFESFTEALRSPVLSTLDARDYPQKWAGGPRQVFSSRGETMSF